MLTLFPVLIFEIKIYLFMSYYFSKVVADVEIKIEFWFLLVHHELIDWPILDALDLTLLSIWRLLTKFELNNCIRSMLFLLIQPDFKYIYYSKTRDKLSTGNKNMLVSQWSEKA